MRRLLRRLAFAVCVLVTLEGVALHAAHQSVGRGEWKMGWHDDRMRIGQRPRGVELTINREMSALRIGALDHDRRDASAWLRFLRRRPPGDGWFFEREDDAPRVYDDAPKAWRSRDHVGAHFPALPTAIGLEATGGLGLLILGLLKSRRRRLKRRRRAGFCGRCGHNLRGARDRCPKCGAIPNGVSSVA